jgi:hypothetical protein
LKAFSKYDFKKKFLHFSNEQIYILVKYILAIEKQRG